MKNKSIYNGSSEGFKFLSDGYMDYAIETILKRSFPDLRDGLKPVNRRTLYAMKEANFTHFTESSNAVGRIMNYHPHGDGSIYDSVCRLTDMQESLLVPLLEGDGNFSKVYLTDKPAAMRYTNVKLAPMSEEFFRDRDGIEMVLDEKGKGLEPAVLPVVFPFLFVGGSKGMAVSFSTGIPSFNFWDVLGLLEKALYKDSLGEDDIIVPDFPTGGYILNNRKEFANIMMTGEGTLKLFADVQVAGKEINITEVPYGYTVQGMVNKLRKLDLPGVSSLFESTDHKSEKSGNKITITCKSKSRVEEVLMDLHRFGVVRSYFKAQMKAVFGGEPVFTGVFPMMRRWLSWRLGLIKGVCSKNLERLYETRSELDYFVRLVRDVENRDKFIDLMVNKSVKDSKDFLYSLFDGISESEVNFICERRLSQFNNGGKYAEKMAQVEEAIEYELKILNNPKLRVQEDIDRLRAENKGKYERKTRITYKDYKFSVISDSDIEDESPCSFKVSPHGVYKLKDIAEDGSGLFGGYSNDVLVGFDTMGRGVRVYGNDLSYGRFCNFSEYFGVAGAEGYSVPLLVPEKSGVFMLFYSDGHCSFFNSEDMTSGQRRALTVKNVVPAEVKDKLTHILYVPEMKEFLVLGQDNKRCIIQTSDIRVKGSAYRTLLVDTDEKFDYIEFMTKEEVLEAFGNPLDYFERMTEVK